MEEARKARARHMPRLREQAGDVPDRLLRLREVIGEKAAAVLLGKKAVEAPHALGQLAHIKKVDNQQFARLRAFHADRPGQEMHDGEIKTADVVTGFILLDEAAGPGIGLDL